jgi:hypothetical protein
MLSKSKLKVVLLATLMLGLLQGCGENYAPDLTAAKAKSEHCAISEDTAEVRKNHFEYILHKRDETMYDGIRTEQHSLTECVNCHVPEKGSDGKKLHYGKAHGADDKYSSDMHFCASCHEYAAVKIDCFTCHRDTPEVAAAGMAYQHQDQAVQAAVEAGAMQNGTTGESAQ